MDEMQDFDGFIVNTKSPFYGAYGDFGGFTLRFPSFFVAFYQVFPSIYGEHG